MKITEYAISRGYESTLLFIPPMRFLGENNIYAQKARAEGYQNAIDKNNTKGQIITSEDDVVECVKSRSEKTAVLCASDIYALKLLKRFKKEGIKVPEDVGLTGFDNIESLDFFEKRLTTVDYPIGRIGEIAVEQLLGIIEGKEPKSHIAKCEIIQGLTL